MGYTHDNRLQDFWIEADLQFSLYILAVGPPKSEIVPVNPGTSSRIFSISLRIDCSDRLCIILPSCSVIDKNVQKITMTSSFIRTILYIIGAQAFLLCLGVVMIGFTEYKQGLHDIFANTYVVTTYWDGPVPLEDNFGA